MTDSSNIPAVSFPSIDKIVHFCFHFGFTISWILFFKKELKGKAPDDYKAYLISFIFSVFFGITIEILQSVLTTTRAADVTDILAIISPVRGKNKSDTVFTASTVPKTSSLSSV